MTESSDAASAAAASSSASASAANVWKVRMDAQQQRQDQEQQRQAEERRAELARQREEKAKKDAAREKARREQEEKEAAEGFVKVKRKSKGPSATENRGADRDRPPPTQFRRPKDASTDESSKKSADGGAKASPAAGSEESAPVAESSPSASASVPVVTSDADGKAEVIIKKAGPGPAKIVQTNARSENLLTEKPATAQRAAQLATWPTLAAATTISPSPSNAPSPTPPHAQLPSSSLNATPARSAAVVSPTPHTNVSSAIGSPTHTPWQTAPVIVATDPVVAAEPTPKEAAAIAASSSTTNPVPATEPAASSSSGAKKTWAKLDVPIRYPPPPSVAAKSGMKGKSRTGPSANGNAEGGEEGDNYSQSQEDGGSGPHPRSSRGGARGGRGGGGGGSNRGNGPRSNNASPVPPNNGNLAPTYNNNGNQRSRSGSVASTLSAVTLTEHAAGGFPIITIPLMETPAEEAAAMSLQSPTALESPENVNSYYHQPSQSSHQQYNSHNNNYQSRGGRGGPRGRSDGGRGGQTRGRGAGGDRMNGGGRGGSRTNSFIGLPQGGVPGYGMMMPGMPPPVNGYVNGAYVPMPPAMPFVPQTYYPPMNAMMGPVMSDGADVDIDTVRGWIRTQIEYYFSVENLARDLYFRRQMSAENGTVAFRVILNFNRVRNYLAIAKSKVSAAHIANHANTTTFKPDPTENPDWSNEFARACIAGSEAVEIVETGSVVVGGGTEPGLRRKENWQHWIIPADGIAPLPHQQQPPPTYYPQQPMMNVPYFPSGVPPNAGWPGSGAPPHQHPNGPNMMNNGMMPHTWG